MIRLIISCFGFFMLVACAMPAHHSTPFWESSRHYLRVTPLPSGLYQLDNYLTSYQGLERILISHQKAGLNPDILINDPFHNDYQAQLQLLDLADKYQLKVHQAGFVGVNDTSRAGLMELIAAEQASEPEQSD